MVERLIWVQEAASSNLAIRTNGLYNLNAAVAKQANASDLKSLGHCDHTSSNLVSGTIHIVINNRKFLTYNLKVYEFKDKYTVKNERKEENADYH